MCRRRCFEFNGLTAARGYDALGRYASGYVCTSPPPTPCTGSVEKYGNSATFKGSQLQKLADTALDQAYHYSYDDFNRLTATNNTSNVPYYTYVYDRYGNRLQQNYMTYDGENRMTAVAGGGGGSYAYDGNGTHGARTGS